MFSGLSGPPVLFESFVVCDTIREVLLRYLTLDNTEGKMSTFSLRSLSYVKVEVLHTNLWWYTNR